MSKLDEVKAKVAAGEYNAGEAIKIEFLDANGITAYALGKATKMPFSRFSHILKGERAITVDTALKLESFFDVPAEYWLELQNIADLRIARLAQKNIKY